MAGLSIRTVSPKKPPQNPKEIWKQIRCLLEKGVSSTDNLVWPLLTIVYGWKLYARTSKSGPWMIREYSTLLLILKQTTARPPLPNPHIKQLFQQNKTNRAPAGLLW